MEGGCKYVVAGSAGGSQASMDVRTPAEALVAASLRARMNWARHVAPRLERFRRLYPEAQTVEELHRLVAPLTDGEVAAEVLDMAYNTPANRRPAMLRDLVLAFASYRREAAAGQGDGEWLLHWARATPDHPHNWISRVPGVGPNTLEWLRALVAIQAARASSRVHVSDGQAFPSGGSDPVCVQRP